MGNNLSQMPITSKVSMFCMNEQYCVGSSRMQGCPASMQDFNAQILSLPDDPGTAFFAVYDGHGGDRVAKYICRNLHKFIVRRPEYRNNIEEAMRQAFLEVDKEIFSHNICGSKTMGSTAVVVLIKNNKLHCANVGDSHAVAYVSGTTQLLSVHHVPENNNELQRIQNAGGTVKYHRVNNQLALSRAFGDFIFKGNKQKEPKEQMVTAYPDVRVLDINGDFKFIVIASDGIWEVLKYPEVTLFCQNLLANGKYPDEICEALMDRCVIKSCCTYNTGPLFGCDNMAVVIIFFLNGRSYEELVRDAKTAAPSLSMMLQ